jgi:hypothetical protein
MIRTAYNNRFRDRKDAGTPGRAPRLGRRDAPPRREGGGRRENATVVHPWMSLPERLAATQAAMRELAGTSAFSCPLGESLTPAPTTHGALPEAANDTKPRTGVNIIIRKRRLPVGMIPSVAGVS